MEMYGLQAPDFFHVDDLLDFSNDDLFSSTTTTTDSDLPPLKNPNENFPSAAATTTTATTTTNPNPNPNRTSNFADDLCFPSDDVAELEWLSNFVDESFSDFPMTDFTGNMNLRYDASVTGKARSKRSRIGTTHNSWISSPESDIPVTGKSKQGSSRSNNNYRKKESSSSVSSVIVAGDQSPPSSASSSGVRRCTHCASEKTPQWRTGPMGPKTLCNACGVRYKSGRLVPEYRPAASPTFVLTQHSNSHRKVMELRRQKEVIRQESNRHEFFHHDFKVC